MLKAIVLVVIACIIISIPVGICLMLLEIPAWVRSALGFFLGWWTGDICFRFAKERGWL